MGKRNIIRRSLAAIAATCTLAFSAVFGGCIVNYGRDPVNGKDLNIYDIYAAVKQETGNEELTFQQFLKEYLSYDSSQLEEATSLKAAINRSLLASVSVRADFGAEFYSYGSGVILDVDREKGDMTVVTNCHVIYSADALYNYFPDGDGYSREIYLWLFGSESSQYKEANDKNKIRAQLVAASKQYDIAVLKVTDSDNVKKSQARKAEWSSGEENYIGETVYAVGNANREMLSANVGYISKDLEEVSLNFGTETKDDIRSFDVIRTSAAISGGNSGGGLFNSSGELAGIVNSRGKDELAGAGYALTGSAVRRVVSRMLDDYDGSTRYGVNIAKHGVNAVVSDCYTSGLNEQGVAEKVEIVTVNGKPAGKCLGKIEDKDILRRVKIVRGSGENAPVIEDIEIKRRHNFTDAMISVRAGDTVYFTVSREVNKEIKDVTVSVTFTDSDFDFKN